MNFRAELMWTPDTRTPVVRQYQVCEAVRRVIDQRVLLFVLAFAMLAGRARAGPDS